MNAKGVIPAAKVANPAASHGALEHNPSSNSHTAGDIHQDVGQSKWPAMGSVQLHCVQAEGGERGKATAKSSHPNQSGVFIPWGPSPQQSKDERGHQVRQKGASGQTTTPASDPKTDHVPSDAAQPTPHKNQQKGKRIHLPCQYSWARARRASGREAAYNAKPQIAPTSVPTATSAGKWTPR